MYKPILCLDFDGVIHAYNSGWKGAGVISDEPNSGAIEFISDAIEKFEIHIFSSRSKSIAGRRAMKKWLYSAFRRHWGSHAVNADDIYTQIKWPWFKPSAFLTIDDRAITFTGVWPNLDELRGFKPWNKQ